MDARNPEPTQDLHGREALAPVFDALNAHVATIHFNGQSTVELDGDQATGESYCLARHLTEAEDGIRTLMVAAVGVLTPCTVRAHREHPHPPDLRPAPGHQALVHGHQILAMRVHLPWPDPGGMEPASAQHNRQRHVLGSATVSRVGFGAMQLPGPGVFGPPRDRDEAIAVLRRAADLGVDHIDTAQFYGPDVANELIRAALFPYPEGLALVSKVGARRDASGGVLRYDQPGQLRQGIEDNLRSLAVGHLAVVNLRLMDDARPDQRFDDQLAAMVKARDDGLIGGVGLSNVSRDHLRHALAGTDIACVQNLMNLADRRSMPVLEECHARGIAFVPFFPLGSGLATSNLVLASPQVTDTAARLGCTPAHVALSWLLDLRPEVLLIPGTSSMRHLEENMAVASLALDQEARELLVSAA